jgi:hypothetical protein
MSAREREGLIRRIRQIRSASATTGRSPQTPEATPDPGRSIEVLESRIAHLEELVEGLQDSVYRESQRQTRRIADLEARLEPASLAAALSKDARERGL